MWPIRFSCVHFCMLCLLFLIIRQNASQAAPVQHLAPHSQGAQESLKEPDVEFQWTNRTGSGSRSSLGLLTSLSSKASQQVRIKISQIVHSPRKKNQDSDKRVRSRDKKRPVEDLSKEIFPSLPEAAPAHRSQYSRDFHESLKEPQVEFEGSNKTDDNTDRVETRKSGSGTSTGLPTGLRHKSSQQVRKKNPPIVHSHRKKNQNSDKRVRSRKKQRPVEDLSKEIFPSLPEAAPAHRSQFSRLTHESLKEPHLEFQGPNKTENNKDHVGTRRSGSGSSLGLPTGLPHNSSQQVHPPIVHSHRKKNQNSDKRVRSRKKQRPVDDLSKEIFPSLPEAAPTHRSQYSRLTHESLKEPHVEFQGPNKTENNKDHVETRKSGSGSSLSLPTGLPRKSSQQMKEEKPPIVHSPRKNTQNSDKRVRSRKKQRPIDDLSKQIFPSLPEAAPTHRSQYSRLTHESLKEPHVEFQGPNKTENNKDHVETRKSGSGSSLSLPTGLPRKSSQQMKEEKPPIVHPSRKNEESDKEGRSDGKQRPIEDLSFRAGKEVTTKRRPKELTIPLARNIMGNLARRMDNPWAVTYGDVWHDTRLAVAHFSRMPRIHLASSPRVDYYPDDAKLVSVCKTKSTLYYSYHFRWIQKTSWKWVARHVYEKPFEFRRISIEARDAAYDEECHSIGKKRKTTVLEHLDCTLKAYQEMEYRMPQYPKRQDG
ncbi:uncharacterized protein [Drosophila pseudoobscura]|uniref:Uncharacterized protein isoform X1 n=1 Tax=Drosophila pseudoobscura pseudoobscura TaxID=46245 RepID=A0A6I8V501_DROPS|nr:uncharacterized protein LOC6898984 isoform X1 [Drosophila pseudoobscura]